MDFKFYNEQDINFLLSSIIIDDNCITQTYSEEIIQKCQEKTDAITHDFFDNFFCVCIAPYNKSRINDKAHQKSYYINSYLKTIEFVDDDLKFAYNVIMSIFDLRHWARVSGFYNIIEFKFKILNNTKMGLATLEESREFCVELCNIFNRPELEQEYDDRIYNYLIKKNTFLEAQKIGIERTHMINNFYQTNRIPKLMYDYDKIAKDLSKYIRGGTSEIYKYIIENKKYPEKTSWQPLTMLSRKKTDIVRFADCFEIPLSKISKIFDEKVETKNRDKNSVNDFLRVLRRYNESLYKENCISK